MSAQDFGANDWLVDEMYEHYLADPTSVDPAWIEYFKANKPGSPVGSNGGSTVTVNPGAVKNSPPTPPIPKSVQQATGQQVTQPIAQPVSQATVSQVAPPVTPTPSTQPVVREKAITPATP
ncbi:MAG: 2-oxoglutarate dehydrogenase component, partial [Actinomycetota bacterium]